MKKVFLFCMAVMGMLSAARVYAQPGTVNKIVGSGVSGFNGEGIRDTLANFNNIRGFCKDGAGNMYIADVNNFRIRKVDATTHMVTTIAGTGVNGYSGDGGLGPLAKISSDVSGIRMDHSGNVIFTDGSRVRKINTTTGIITTIAGGGSILADGIPATSVQLYRATSLYLDSIDNIYFGDRLTTIRKVDAGTGLISTIAGMADSFGFSGDGGPATNATMNAAFGIAMDATGNIYFADINNRRIRKINTSGIITTIAGNGSATYSNDGGPATNAGLFLSGGMPMNENIEVDSAGNVYFLDNQTGYAYVDQSVVLRKISAGTGIINKVAGMFFSSSFTGVPPGEALFNAQYFTRNSDGSFLFARTNTIHTLSNDYSAIRSMSFSDTMLTAPCVMRAATGSGIYGLLSGIPAAGDSLHIQIRYGDDSITRMAIPYWSMTDSATGSPVYGFGAHGNWLPQHTYILPGVYTPTVYLSLPNGYQQVMEMNTVHASSVCDSGIWMLGILSLKDSVISPSCASPAFTQCVIKGFVRGNVTSLDSVYLRITNGNGTKSIVVVPVDLASTSLPVLYGDSAHLFTYTYTNSYSPQLYTPYWGVDTVYSRRVYAISNNGLFADENSGSAGDMGVIPNPYFDASQVIAGFQIENCVNSSVEGTTTVWTTGSASCAYTIPYDASVQATGYVHGAAAGMGSFPVRITFSDGGDTVVRCTITPVGDGFYAYSSPSFHHIYTIEGDYFINTTLDTTLPYFTDIAGVGLHLISSCTPVDGTFYIDANNNCTADAGEVRLSHWPFLVVNHTTGDTTNAWADENGSYHLSLFDTNSYTIIANHASYFGDGSAGDSLVVACPVSGIYDVTAGAGLSFTQDFGFNCMGAAGTVDMSVAGWGWGFVPGDTGIISIWSSDAWGYICDSLTSTITLTIDTNLSYIGMWNGPLPTTITGNVLTWTFSTVANLFDFTANIKVLCDTTAMMGDTAHNMLHISPTALADPNLTNNTYSWTEPIRSSFDPNEKEVSPKGFGVEGYIENGTPLSYMIHFQNSGTAPASNIKVIDTISANLDLATLQIVSSSAPVLIYQTGPHTVQFRFNDINLPDSTSDPEGSKGYVAFNILPVDDLAAGTQIVNGAGIYFDYNPPIYTNTTINTIEDTVRATTGASTVCVGANTTLVNTLAGGVWSATNAHATVSGGVVTGVTAGIDTIVYTVYGNKSVYKIITVLVLPDAGTITGTGAACIGAVTTLSNTTTGGTWSSSTPVAAVTAGIVTGVSAGSTIISYAVTNSCGTVADTMEVTINTIPVVSITSGIPTVCQAATTTLANATTGGTWSSSATTATVAGGVVTGSTAGTAVISYTVTNDCGIATDTMEVTINPLPVAGTITGASAVCEGATTTLTNTITGGIWSSSAAAATVAGGILTGATAGTATISYAVTNGCGTATDTMLVTVTALPDAGAITGVSSICTSASASLTNTATTGTWLASNGALNISASGVITGVTAGTDTVMYIVSNTCGADTTTRIISVANMPLAGSIIGADSICEGASMILTESASGGVWSTSSAAIATLTASGAFTAVAPGIVTVSYAVTNSCGTATATYNVTVLSTADCNTGVANTAQADQLISIYPNPSNGSFTVEIPQPGNDATITVTDISGKVVATIKPTANDRVIPVYLTNLASGTYLIKVTADGRVYRDKAVLWK